MSSIVENQRAAFVHQAMNDLRATAHSLRNLSPAEQAASIGCLAHALQCPVDMVVLYDDPQDALDAASILDGVAPRCSSVPYAWRITGDSHFSLVCLRKDGAHV